ncbi:MAG: hypothetical protein QOJ09_2274, partial [Actinomycetota bacterium]|nr:hypothetical protein [Actinomycetota bacterium]
MLVTLAAPGGAQVASTTSAPPPPPPKAWLLADADTGAVLSVSNDREPKPVASLSKIVTALAVVHALKPGTDIPVSAKAEGMPARKINMKAGQVWTLEDSLTSMLLSSANDAAVALAERASGSLEAFIGDLDATASRIGMQDHPVLRDPAGLDDEFSVDGGNLISARDLAIAARALLHDKRLAQLVASDDARFVGGDAIQHHLINHNRLLRTYPGAIGVKTGYTRKAGHSLIAAAKRDGRTMIAVVFGAADPDRSAAALLDKGFGTPLTAEVRELERLPDISHGNANDPVTKAPPPPRPVSTPTRAQLASVHPAHLREWAILALGGFPALLILALRLRAKARVKRRRRSRSSAGPALVTPPRHDVIGTAAY